MFAKITHDTVHLLSVYMHELCQFDANELETVVRMEVLLLKHWSTAGQQ